MHSGALRLDMSGEVAQEAVTGLVDALGERNNQGLTRGDYVSFDVPDLMDSSNLYPWVKLATALKKMVFEVILPGVAGKLSLSSERQQILTEQQGRDLEERIRGGEFETFTTKPGDLTVIGPQTIHRRARTVAKIQDDRFVMVLNLLHGSEVASKNLAFEKLLKRLEG